MVESCEEQSASKPKLGACLHVVHIYSELAYLAILRGSLIGMDALPYLPTAETRSTKQTLTYTWYCVWFASIAHGKLRA